LDLEADLSIDSIKRVEVIGDVAERVGLPGAADGRVDESVVEELAQLKTLAAITDWIAGATGADRTPAAPVAAAPSPGPAAEADAPATAAGPAVPERSLRCVVEAVDVPAEPAAARLGLAGAAFVVTDDGSGVATELAGLLVRAGATARTLAAADLGGPDASGLLEQADGVVHLALAGTGGAPTAFAALAPAALGAARRLVCVTPAVPPLGGPPAGAGAGGTATGAVAPPGGEGGFLRALAHEVPDRVVRHVAVDPAAAPADIAAAVADELGRPGPLDVARLGGRRLGRRVVVTERPAASAAAATTGPDAAAARDGVLDPGAVVLLTGGARGITARFAVSFAEAGAAHVELVGRSALPEGPEPDDLAGAADAAALRAALLRRGETRVPAEIEAQVRRVLAEREVRATLDAVKAAGAVPRYHRADVRDALALEAVVADVYARHGRLDGVVHGAGLIEDRYLRDKTAESFDRVYGTKVTGARALLGAVREDVGFVVFFGSVSGVFGNKGQVDYAAANDTLDALARTVGGPGGRLAGRVLGIDWGPWGGTGMVSDELAREYARRGVGLVEPADGLAALWDELAARRAAGAFPDAQVVVVRATPETMGAAGA
jgi:NAD(P)-dependent dehydrogenase (short-subunit alcohol dehydrogenase family)